MADRIEVGEGGVPANARRRVDVDRSDGEAELRIETAEIGDEGIAGIRRGIEDGVMEGRQFLTRRGMDA